MSKLTEIARARTIFGRNDGGVRYLRFRKDDFPPQWEVTAQKVQDFIEARFPSVIFHNTMIDSGEVDEDGNPGMVPDPSTDRLGGVAVSGEGLGIAFRAS